MMQSQLNQSQPPPPPSSTSASEPPLQQKEPVLPLPVPLEPSTSIDQSIKSDPEDHIDDVVDTISVNVAKDEILSCDDKTTSLSNNDNNNNTSSNTDDDDKISTKSSNDGRNDRRVSFPKQDDKLVTGYLEPANPWASVKKLLSSNDLEQLYRDSCKKHTTEPIESVLEHLKSIDLKSNDRLPILNLKDIDLTAEACEALEEILKRVQYRCIDVSSCGLDDTSASALFDMIEYYEAANELDISENRNITNIGWQSCISMVKKSHALHVLSVRATVLSDNNAINLGKAMLSSSLHTLKLEHCGLTGRPISSLCTNLKRNVVLRELWLAHNDLTQHDAYNIALLLKTNYYIQYLDISNNYIEDSGVGYIVDALIEQTQKLNELNMPSSSSTSTSSIISPLTALPPTTASLITSTTLSSSSALPSNNNNNTNNNNNNNNTNNNINKSDDSCNDKILSDIDNSNKNISISSIENEDRDDANGISGDRNLKIDDGGGGGGGEDGGGDTTINKNNISDNNSCSSNNNDNNISNINKLSGRSKLDVLLTNLNENNSDNQNNFNNDDSILVQKTNIDLLTTIYEHQNNNNNNNSEDKSNNNNNDSGVITSIVNNNDNNKVQDEAEEDGNLIVIAKKLDTVNEEESDDNDTASNSGDGDIMSTTSGTIEPIIVDDVKPNIINNNSNDILVQTEIPNNIIELKIVEDTDYICDDNNDKNNSVNNNNNNENNINEDLLEKSTESFEFIDPNAIDIIIPIVTSSSSTITSLSSESNNNSNSNNNINGNKNDGEKILSQSFDDSILLKPDPSITSNNNIESAIIEQKPSGSPIKMTTENLPPPERSLSSDSLNSDTSIDSNDSKSSIKLAEMKFGTRNNGTLERQQQINDKLLSQDYSNITQPTGLQVLIFWNNQITRHSSKSFSDLLSKNNSLEILNVGRNVLSNDFVTNIKTSLKQNTTLTNLGLQGAHLSCPGIKGLSEILDFGGNSTLQRIDLRDNNIETAGLTALDEAMKSNKSVTRIDLDDTPRKIVESSGNSTNDYTRLVNSIRGHCTRNEKPSQETELIRPNLKKVRSAYKCSRKISLTCQSIRPTNEQIDRNLLDPNNKHLNSQQGHILNSNNCLSNGTTIKSIGRLKSPLPSPNPSPMSSPIPSPSRNRFHVSKVLENINSTSPSSSSLISTSSSTNSSPSSFSNSRFRVTAVNDINKKPIKIEKSRFTVQTLVCKPISDTVPLHVPPPPPPPPPPVQLVKPIIKEDNDQNNFQFNFDETTTNLMRNTVMGDSCSSLSSMDSIDRPFNSSSNDDSSSIDNIIISPKFLNDSLSSLEDNFIEVNRKEILIPNPPKKLFSKDHDDNDTLTNSATKQTNITNTTNLHNADKNATKNSTSGSGRVRKTSFFGPSNPSNEPNYTPPPAIAQLLSIFKKSDSNTITNSSANHQASSQVHAIRKESPMSGLFSHLFTSSSSSNKSKHNVEEVVVQSPVIKPLSTSSSATNSSNSSNSQILQHKMSDNSFLTDSHVTTVLMHGATNLENTKIPIDLKQEIKENISPENTITAENLMNIEQPIGLAREIEPEVTTERVHFEVGGDDDEDEEDDGMDIDTTNENDMSLLDDITISTSTSTTATGNLNTNSCNSITATIVGDSKSSSISSLNLSHANEHSLNSKLGQIARDSLALLKGNSLNDSQDSMILFEIDPQQTSIPQSTMSDTTTKTISPNVETDSTMPQTVITISTQESQQHQHEKNEANN